MEQGQVVGRFAPTPSGRMHLGNAFSALLCWLWAKKQGGRLIFRVEDLDLLRTREEYTRGIMEDLRWMGLDWDEGPGAGPAAQAGRYYQSRRSAFYEDCLQTLEQKGLLYPCFCSRAQLHAASAPHRGDGSYVYDGRCRALSAQQRAERARQRPGAVRVRVPDAVIAFEDACLGPQRQNLAAECGDFILRRSDGVFAYQLAAPADDGDMGVTQVVRGADLLPSTARQIWLLETLGYTPPRYAHHPVLLAGDGRRLAKRDRDLDLAAIRARIARPEPLVGLLAHLAGLAPSPRPLAARDLVADFSWERVPKEDIPVSGALLAGLLGGV